LERKGFGGWPCHGGNGGPVRPLSSWEQRMLMSTRQRLIGLLPLVLLLTVGPAAAQEPGPPRQEPEKKEKPVKPKYNLSDKLKFMAGCWQGQIGPDALVEEIWTNPSENLLTSTTRYLTKNRATSFEFSKIEARDSTIIFAASSEGRPFDEYTLKSLVDEYVVFENLKKTFPQRIIYRLASDGSLIPRNEGEGQSSVEVRFRKVKCPGS